MRQRIPEAFALVVMTLPYLGDEGSLWASTVKILRQRDEVDVAVSDLQALPILTEGIGNMQVGRERPDLIDEGLE